MVIGRAVRSKENLRKTTRVQFQESPWKCSFIGSKHGSKRIILQAGHNHIRVLRPVFFEQLLAISFICLVSLP